MQVNVLRANYTYLPAATKAGSSAAPNSGAILADNGADFSQSALGTSVKATQRAASTGIMNALLDDQQGTFVPVQYGANGLPQLALTAPVNSGANRPDVHGELGMAAGELTVADLNGQTATSLADELIRTLGSNDSLSLSDVETALTPSSSDNQQWLADTRKLIESDWNHLTGGSETLSQSQLTAAIQAYKPQIYAEATSLQQIFA